MIKRLLCCMLILSLTINTSIIKVFAAENNDGIYQTLVQKYNELKKAEFQTYEFKFENLEEYGVISGSKLDFNDGVVGGSIDDFDNDGQYELLVFEANNDVYSTDKYPDRITNSINACVYEVIDGKAKLTDSSPSVYGVMNGDSGGTECFVKIVGNKKYIVIQSTYQNTVFADGAFTSVLIMEYSNNTLKQVSGHKDSGSAPRISEDKAIAFKNLGFINTYNFFCDGSYVSNEGGYIYNPYWDSFNIAKIEDNVQKIVEVLVTNNSDGFTYGYENDDYEAYIKNLAANVKMTVKINNYTNITAVKNITVILNGQILYFAQPPYIENGTTRVPMRAIFEALGATVDYDAMTKTITASKDGTVIELVTDSSTAKINGREMILTVPVENRNGSTMVPLRFVSEALGAEVIWDEENKVIIIDL